MDAQLLIETVCISASTLPEAFGTADALINADGCKEVKDFKYARRASSQSKPQMMIYALGAYEVIFDYRIERVRMTSVQPRIDNLSEYELSVAS
jgi:hypothetical protein